MKAGEIMTLQQEAYALIQEQPESNLRIIIDLLKALGSANLSKENKTNQVIMRTGVGRDVIKLPEDFLEHFDDSNDVIAKMFYGDSI